MSGAPPRARRCAAHRVVGALLFEGGVDVENLFTVEEAGRVFREWLRAGAGSGFVLNRVVY